MATYVMLSRMTPAALAAIREEPDRIAHLDTAIEAYEAKVLGSFQILGDYDQCTIFEAPDNFAAYRASLQREVSHTADTEILPAIDLPLFRRLLTQTTETTGPYPWQIRLPAQVVRRAVRYRSITRHVREACEPLTVEGSEHLRGLKGPCVVIGNHGSHLDSLVLFQALPERYRRRLAYAAAADRWFLKGREGMTKQGWWQSLTMNSFPIQRGGGSKALDYPKWLLEKGWSVAIFPEGTRSTSRHLGKFRHGPSILALEMGVPVVPVYMAGLREIRPKGQREITPGPVTARILEPLRFAAGTDVATVTRTLFEAMNTAHEEFAGRHPGPAQAQAGQRIPAESTGGG